MGVWNGIHWLDGLIVLGLMGVFALLMWRESRK